MFPSSPDSLRGPHDHLQTLRKMQQRFAVGQQDAVRLDHVVTANHRLGALQRPRPVMHLASQDAAARILREEAIPLGQPVLERAGL